MKYELVLTGKFKWPWMAILGCAGQSLKYKLGCPSQPTRTLPITCLFCLVKPIQISCKIPLDPAHKR